MLRTLQLRLPQLGRLPRLLVVGTCLLLALSSALGAKRGGRAKPLPTTAVVVAARALPIGHTLTAGDLVVSRWPASVRLPGARADPHGLIGARLATPLATREPVTPQRLVGIALTDALPPGLVAAAVSLDDPHAADLTRAGGRVDVLASPRPAEDGDPPANGAVQVQTLATGALVLAVLPQTDQGSAEVVVAVVRATAVALTRHRTDEILTLIADPP